MSLFLGIWRAYFSSQASKARGRFGFSSQTARVGAVLGALCVPIAGYSLYERCSPLPFPSDIRFPLAAKYYIRRALWAQEMEQKAYYLDQAMRKVLAAGLGAASPQSTALVIYLSQLYLDNPHTDESLLKASHAALVHKPHIGEGVTEERARLEMSFKVVDKLCDLLIKSDPSAAREYAERALFVLDKAPPYLCKHWRSHPLRPKLEAILDSE